MEGKSERRARDSAFDMSTAFVFMKAVEHSSFAEAASSLGMTRSAISKRIAQLERDLGVTLLNRTPRRISLTDVGQSFYESCTKIRDAMEKAADEIRGSDEQATGVLRASLPSALGSTLMPRLVSELLSEWRQLKVDLHLEDRFVDVIGGGYDVVVRIDRKLTDSSLFARRIATTSKILVASPKYLARFGAPRRSKELARHHCLGRGRPAERSVTWALSGPEGPLEIQVPCTLTANSDADLIWAASLGMGIFLVPELLVADELSQGRLKRVLPSFCGDHDVGVFAMHPYKRCPAKVQIFIELVERHFKAAAESAGACRLRPKA